ncbi:hypothetical protein [Anthocerotibacter panamensis]|uniref:hypothetical protein n=1 Tax=Anthocerotibacter panamensis TaxID=2857077 RepID=UPI001C404402|nr:hypothetical protein [Anthocerotibacter panamensis]
MTRRKRAGQNVYDMADTRRAQATYQMLWAVGVGLLPAMLLYFSPFPLLSLLPCGLGGFLLYRAKGSLKRAAHAQQGAQAEEYVASLLVQLPRGWRCEYGRVYPGVGDVDITVFSPGGRAWTIDVKSHWGRIILRDGTLMRHSQGKVVAFQKDFLAQALAQAGVVARSKNLPVVEPVLCFTKAALDCPPRVRGVYLVSAKNLIRFLEGHGERGQ